MKKLPLTLGKYVLIDDEDFEYLNQWKWSAIEKGRKSKNYYAVRVCKLEGMVYMHRKLLGLKKGVKGQYVDHRDGNSLNNQKNNLRICTNQENTRNRVYPSKNNTSGYIGVSWDKAHEKWAPYINVNRKKIYLGQFKSKEEAIKVRLEAEKKYFGEFAPTRV